MVLTTENTKGEIDKMDISNITAEIDATAMENALKEFYDLHAKAKELADAEKKAKAAVLAILGKQTEWNGKEYKVTNKDATRRTLVEESVKKFYNLESIDESCFKVTTSPRFVVDKFVD